MSTDEEIRTREPRPSPLGKAHLGRASLGRVAAQTGAGSGRRAQVAIGVFVAIGIGIAYGYAVAPAAGAPAGAASVASTAVRTATVVCPEVIGANDATISAISPAGGSTPATGDTATVTALGGKAPIATLKQTGAVSVNGGLSGNPDNLNQESVPIIGQAGGAYAPGFTLTETLSSGATGALHGIASTACSAPDTDFWYLGADPSTDTSSHLNLYDGDQLSAQLNVIGYTANGQVDTATVQQKDQGVLVLGGSQAANPVDLSDFSSDGSPIAVHVTTTAGRISAALLDSDGAKGRDFIQPQKPAAHLVIPGVPTATSKIQLILFSPTADADVSLHWIGGSKIVPTTVVPHLTAGKVAQVVDISNVPAAGEAGALQIDSTNNTPILAEIKVTGPGGSDVAYLNPVQALAGESVVADNTSGSVVELTNNAGQDAQVQVSSESTGTPAAQTVTVPAYSTKAVTVQAPKGATNFAISVVPLNGASSIYAARVMTGAGGLLTVQPMTTALETVRIPVVRNDLSGTVPQ